MKMSYFVVLVIPGFMAKRRHLPTFERQTRPLDDDQHLLAKLQRLPVKIAVFHFPPFIYYPGTKNGGGASGINIDVWRIAAEKDAKALKFVPAGPRRMAALVSRRMKLFFPKGVRCLTMQSSLYTRR